MPRQDYAFPFRIDAVSQQAALTSYENHVEQMIRQVLLTSPGERADLPDFGCGLRQYLMEPNTVATRARIQSQVQSALTTWEPRISLTSVDVLPGDDPALVQIAIAYVHVRDGRRDNLVYPFYLE